MSNVVVVADVLDGAVLKPTLELLTIARRLGEPVAVVFGSAADAAAKLGEYGAAKIIEVTDPAVTEYLVAPKAEVLHQIVQAEDPAAVLVPSSAEGKEIAGRLAVKLDSGIITDAVDVQADGTATQSVFAGGWTVTGKVAKGTPVITVKPNAADPEPAAGAGTVEQFSGSVTASGAKIVSTEPKQASGRPELSGAGIVVSGGRGTGGDFAAVEALADELGAAVGASRAAVDSGWYPHAYQVGQTGKTVSPQLYIAAGISGAIQHRAGMQTSKAIVAVNTDEEAPIFEMTDLGIVGDLHKVLPATTEGVKQKKA